MNSPSPSVGKVSRRRFFTTSAAVSATLFVGGALWPDRARGAASNLQWVSLNGAWQMAKDGTEGWIPAQVPGCIHTDLLAAGKIADPFYRDNEKAVQWVGETDWHFRRSFDLDAETLAHQQMILLCEGLATLATIHLNSRELGKTDNMFRTWEFDAKPLLQTGENKTAILINSPAQFVDTLEKKRSENKGVTGRAWLRKQPCQFGWDWAPMLITSGIWRSISLEAVDEARLDDVLILQDQVENRRVGVTIKLTAQPFGQKSLRAKLTFSHEVKTIGEKKIKLSEGKGEGEVVIKSPKLWWPSGIGAQPLYQVRVDLLDADGKSLDAATNRGAEPRVTARFAACRFQRREVQ